MKRLCVAVLVLFFFSLVLVAQEATSDQPWEETVRRIENGKTPDNSPDKFVQAITKILKFFSEFMLKYFGGKGYSDILLFR